MIEDEIDDEIAKQIVGTGEFRERLRKANGRASACSLRRDLEALRQRVDATLGGLEHDGALELSHLAVALGRVQRRIVPPRRPAALARGLSWACERAAGSLERVRWPSARLEALAEEVADQAREVAVQLGREGGVR